MRTALYKFFGRVFHRPPPDHTVTVIAEWMTAKEEHESNPTNRSFIRYQDATTTLINEEQARYVMTELLKARRSSMGD